MPRRPVVSSDRLIKIASQLGFIFRNQSGSHVIMTKKANNTTYLIPIPADKTEVAIGTLHSIVKKIAKSENATTDQIYDLLR